jgi:XTP/dITP diphosphohydrolase
MITLLFATHNINKANELAPQMPFSIDLKTLDELGIHEEIPETGSTLEENARMKTDFLVKLGNDAVFSDDTGLEIEVLNDEPGVYSARYAGEEKDSEKNMDLVLHKLEGKINRKARFRTVISLYIDGTFHEFEGIVEGQILPKRKGLKGFGYDPIFQPDETTCSFAEMSMEEKNKISHRGRAIRKLLQFLKQ